nr:RusA family crossover junction endodeoxyribonuclease [Endozoicomonas sp. ONNA2]
MRFNGRQGRKREKCWRGQWGVLVVAVFPIPASRSKKKTGQAQAGLVRPAVKPDFDNVAKLYCDALNGILWEDDKQIVDGRCIKVYGQQPGVLVIGWPL